MNLRCKNSELGAVPSLLPTIRWWRLLEMPRRAFIKLGVAYSAIRRYEEFYAAPDLCRAQLLSDDEITFPRPTRSVAFVAHGHIMRLHARGDRYHVRSSGVMDDGSSLVDRFLLPSIDQIAKALFSNCIILIRNHGRGLPYIPIYTGPWCQPAVEIQHIHQF